VASRLAYEHLRGSPRLLVSLTGVTVAQFDLLLGALGPRAEAGRAARLARRSRQRGPGGGRRQELPLGDRLLIALLWLNVYPNHEALSELFGVSDSTVSRYLMHLLPEVRPLLEGLGLSVAEDPGRKQRCTLEELLAELPALQRLCGPELPPGPDSSRRARPQTGA
jgi:Helix-turn-helix of DDE superfamily endonuclease